jgi:hypothetical protein
MRMRCVPLPLTLSLTALLLASSAVAADPPPVPPPAGGPAASAPVPSPEAEDKDGVRFRGGVNLAFGGLFGSEGPLDYTGFLSAVDGHIGVQINDLIGVYLVPSLAGGSITASVSSGGTSFELTEGWLAAGATGIVDFTFIDQIFVGVGGGATAHGATCTNCEGLAGGVLHFRFGGYPIMGEGEDGIRRKGLMVGGDMRINFLSLNSQSIMLFQPMVTVGYEAY